MKLSGRDVPSWPLLAAAVFSVSLGTDSQGDCLPDTTTGSITSKLNKGDVSVYKGFQLAL